MHIISLLKFLLSILRKARNLSTLVELRLTTALSRHVLALNLSGVAKNLVRVWLWIVSRGRKPSLPEARPDASLPPEQHFQADNPTDYIACASAPEVIELPSDTAGSSDTAGHSYGADGARVNQNVGDSSNQERRGLSTGATENENPIETAVVSMTGGSNVPVNANSSEMPAVIPTWLRSTTPSLRNRYEQGICMYVVSIFATSIL